MKVVSANECSQFLNSTLVGENISIRSARSIDSIEEYSLIFLSKRDDVSIEKLTKHKMSFVLQRRIYQNI